MAQVSIVVPIYNSEKTLAVCIEAIQGQSYKDFELLLCNDGSEDQSSVICHKFAEEDERIKVYDLPHLGTSSARNAGLSKAIGQYIMFADSDDIPSEDWISFLIKYARPEGLAVCGYSCVDEQGTRLYGAEKNDGQDIENLIIEPEQFIEDIFSNKHMYQGYIWNKIFDVSLVRKHHLHFSEEITYNEDRLFLLKYLFVSKYINYSNIPLYTYSLHTAGRKVYSGRMYTEIDAFEIMRKALNDRKLYAAHRYACRDEYRAISELFPLALACGSADADRLRQIKKELLDRGDDKMPHSYEEFLYFFGLHVPLKDAIFTDTEKKQLYEDFICVSRKSLAEPMDYFKYRFYDLDDAKRETYLMRKQYEELCFRYSTPQARKNVSDKRLFAETYSAYLGRDVLAPGRLGSYERYNEMLQKHEKLLCKPINGGYGQGIQSFSTKDINACKKVWQMFLKGECLIEEFICQHDALAIFHPSSVNTIRSLTVVSSKGRPQLIATAIRTGQGGGNTDNGNGGGIFANIDVESGRITGSGVTHLGETYAYHPDTGISYEDKVIPCWETFQELSLKAAVTQRELRLCCWDWALTGKGKWALIEGNILGGAGLNQAALGKGLRREIEEGLL